jgi:hypothetical protein
MGLLLGEASILPSDEASFERIYTRLHRGRTWPVADNGEASQANP